MTLRDLMHWEKPFNINLAEKKYVEPSILKLQDEVNRFFEHFYRGTDMHLKPLDKKDISMPALDFIEKKDCFKCEVELPGLPAEAVELEISKDCLIIKGEKKEEKEKKEENYLHRETSYGSFYRRLPLPEIADTDKAEASFKNGILSVQIPKKKEAIHETKKLKIKKVA